jgi:uncharacterized protein (TIGR00369 family)
MKAPDPDFVARVRASFHEQRFMTTLGAMLDAVEPGAVTIRVPFRRELTQQDGFLHAGVLASVADSACGYAAFSLMPATARVLSIEFKVNMLAPATGDAIVRASVIRAGKRIMVCRADVFSSVDGSEKLVAAMQGTMMVVEDQ